MSSQQLLHCVCQSSRWDFTHKFSLYTTKPQWIWFHFEKHTPPLNNPVKLKLFLYFYRIALCRRCSIILPDRSWRWDFDIRAHIMSPMLDTKALFSYVLSMWTCLMFQVKRPILFFLKSSYCRATNKLDCQCDFMSYMIQGRVNIVFYSQRGRHVA